jgi:MFS family permease
LRAWGVAIGEASLSPTAPSIIADNFPAERRTLPLSLYAAAGAAGLGASLIAGGFVASLIKSDVVTIRGLGSFAPWQIIFFVVALPGVIMSFVLLTAREPLRRDRDQPRGSFREFWSVVRSRGSILLPHWAGVCVFFIHSFANVAWLPAFLMRVHGWSMADVGLKYGVVHVSCAVIAGLFSGWFAGQLWRRGRRNANLLASASLLLLMTVPAVLGPLVHSALLSVALIAMASIFSIATAGPNVAAIQEIIPNHFRGPHHRALQCSDRFRRRDLRAAADWRAQRLRLHRPLGHRQVAGTHVGPHAPGGLPFLSTLPLASASNSTGQTSPVSHTESNLTGRLL